MQTCPSTKKRDVSTAESSDTTKPPVLVANVESVTPQVTPGQRAQKSKNMSFWTTQIPFRIMGLRQSLEGKMSRLRFRRKRVSGITNRCESIVSCDNAKGTADEDKS